MSDTIISLTNLTKYYGMHRGIDDVSFAVKQGEIFGFIGPNRSRQDYYHPYHDGAFETRCGQTGYLWNGLQQRGGCNCEIGRLSPI